MTLFFNTGTLHVLIMDHLSVTLEPAYKPFWKCSRPVRKQTRIWQPQHSLGTKDCFRNTEWGVFKTAASQGDQINIEHAEAVNSYIAKRMSL